MKAFKLAIKDLTNNDSIRVIHTHVDKINNRIDTLQGQFKTVISTETINENK